MADIKISDLTVASSATGSMELEVNDALTSKKVTVNQLQDAAIGTTNGLIARTATNTVAARTITNSTGIVVSNGNGVSGNPTIAADIASQAEAEAGTASDKLMTPQRVAQAISVQSSSSVVRETRTSGTALALAEKSKLIDITSGTFTQSFESAATLGNGWWCYIRNSGTGSVFLNPNGSETIDGSSALTLRPGETRLVVCTGTLFVSLLIVQKAAFESALFHAVDEKSAGTDGGTSSGGSWVARTINTVRKNEIGATLSGNEITLPSGDYYCEGSAPVYNGNNHRIRLWDTSSGVVLLTGTNAYAPQGADAQTRSSISGRFTLSAQRSVRMEHFIQTGIATRGFGRSVSDALPSVFADIRIWKVA